MNVEELAQLLLNTARDQQLVETSGEFTIDVGEGAMAVAKITVTVVDPGPTLLDDVASTDAGQSVQIFPLSNDVDPLGRELQIVSVTQPENGSVTISGDKKSVTFTPADNFVGDVVFEYEAVPVVT